MPKPLTSTMSIALLLSTAGLPLVANDACAVTRERGFIQNATGACQSALPVFDGQIRKRPLATQNEGTTSAFVNCSLLNPRAGNPVDRVQLLADNNNQFTAVDLTCTLITGTGTFLPKTLTMKPNEGTNPFIWTSADNGGLPFNSITVNVSCNLPVDTAISSATVIYSEDVGA